MVYRKNLKIEFRAVPYTSSSHVLEYRISPEQDITYKKEYSIFGFKFYLNRKFDTCWKQPIWFCNYSWDKFFTEESRCWTPIFINSKQHLREYKIKYKTIGEFYDYLKEHDDKEKQAWEIHRQKYLNERGIWN